MRVWISYTNQWKNHPRADQAEHWEDAKPFSLAAAVDKVSTRADVRKTDSSLEFNPQKAKVLPTPTAQTPPRVGSSFPGRLRRSERCLGCSSTPTQRSQESSVNDASSWPSPGRRQARLKRLGRDGRWHGALPAPAQQGGRQGAVSVSAEPSRAVAGHREVPLHRAWRAFP